ncbi:50S ribosomal protein L29 [Candidatus Bathyarchaeota archaeon]|nr:MAG: 50S ribosomal protein L29 [Candidatus Bathyarchaeota archaeon]
MPIIRMQEIREMSEAERNEKLQELRTEFMKIKTKIKTGGAIESPGRSKVLRRAIAKILTVVNEEE